MLVQVLSLATVLLQVVPSILAAEKCLPGASCPGTVAIMNLKYGRLHCGGSLVTDKHVLTAGVCFVWYNFTMMEVLLGLDSFDDLTKIVTKRTFVDVTIHDKYHFGAVRDKNDLAIGILNKPVVFSATIVPVCLPEKDRKLKDQGTIVGWGRMGMLTSHARSLMKASVSIMSEEDCLNSKPKKYIDDETMFCAFSEKGGCQGDVGGPLLDIAKDKKLPVLIGVFTKVSVYVDWIGNHTEGGKKCSTK